MYNDTQATLHFHTTGIHAGRWVVEANGSDPNRGEWIQIRAYKRKGWAVRFMRRLGTQID